MLSVIPRWELEQFVDGKNGSSTRELIQPNPMIAFADEPLRFVVQRMASTGLTKFPVVERNAPSRPIGMVALTDLLKARVAHIESEERREQVLRLPLLFGSDDENREKPA